MSANACNILVISTDAALREALRATLDGARETQLTIVAKSIDETPDFAEADRASVIVADIDEIGRAHV